MQNRRSLKRLGRDTLLYAISSVLARVVSFVMLPVYTRYLTPADYGILSMLDLSVEVTTLLFSAGATAGLTRFYFLSDKPDDRNRVLFTAWASASGLYLAGSIALLVAAPLIWKTVLGGAGTIAMVQLTAANFTIGALAIVPLQMLSIDQRPVAASVVAVIKLLMQVGLNVLFIVALQLGPIGILWSTFGSSLVIALVMTVVLLRRTGIAWDRDLFWQLRRFSLPLQISSAGTFVLTYGDRFFLQHYHGLAAVGLYGLAYQFGFLAFGLVAYPFFQAWIPQRFQFARDPRDSRDLQHNRGFFLGDLLIIACATGIALFSRPVLAIMTTAEFHSAAAYVPLLVLAYVFQAWNQVADFGIEVSGRTRYTSISTWIAVSVILVLYATLIPPLGPAGAAIATLIAMIVRFCCTLWFAQRLSPITYDWRRHLLLLAGGVAAASASFLAPSGSNFYMMGIASLLFVGFATWTWTAVLQRTDRDIVIAVARAPRSIVSLIASQDAVDLR